MSVKESALYSGLSRGGVQPYGKRYIPYANK